MKWLLIAGLLLTEIHMPVYWIWPETAEIELALFPGSDQKITVMWYIYELSAMLNKAIWAYVFTNITEGKLYRISAVFVLYNITQIGFYCYNRNSSFAANIIVYACMAILIAVACLPNKKAIIKKM